MTKRSAIAAKPVAKRRSTVSMVERNYLSFELGCGCVSFFCDGAVVDIHWCPQHRLSHGIVPSKSNLSPHPMRKEISSHDEGRR